MDTHSGLYNTSYSMTKMVIPLISTGDLEIMSTRYDSVVVKKKLESFSPEIKQSGILFS